MHQRSNITYGQLGRILRSFGFSRRVYEENGKGVRYQHKQTGALILLPLYPDSARVYNHHLLAIRGTLDNFGVADRSVFEAKLKKVG